MYALAVAVLGTRRDTRTVPLGGLLPRLLSCGALAATASALILLGVDLLDGADRGKGVLELHLGGGADGLLLRLLGHVLTCFPSDDHHWRACTRHVRHCARGRRGAGRRSRAQ